MTDLKHHTDDWIIQLEHLRRILNRRLWWGHYGQAVRAWLVVLTLGLFFSKVLGLIAPDQNLASGLIVGFGLALLRVFPQKKFQFTLLQTAQWLDCRLASSDLFAAAVTCLHQPATSPFQAAIFSQAAQTFQPVKPAWKPLFAQTLTTLAGLGLAITLLAWPLPQFTPQSQGQSATLQSQTPRPSPTAAPNVAHRPPKSQPALRPDYPRFLVKQPSQAVSYPLGQTVPFALHSLVPTTLTQTSTSPRNHRPESSPDPAPRVRTQTIRLLERQQQNLSQRLSPQRPAAEALSLEGQAQQRFKPQPRLPSPLTVQLFDHPSAPTDVILLTGKAVQTPLTRHRGLSKRQSEASITSSKLPLNYQNWIRHYFLKLRQEDGP